MIMLTPKKRSHITRIGLPFSGPSRNYAEREIVTVKAIEVVRGFISTCVFESNRNEFMFASLLALPNIPFLAISCQQELELGLYDFKRQT